jgi:hypothetical protein
MTEPDEGWTQPVAGEMGMTWAERQAAWDAQMAGEEELWGPGYTEPPYDWDPNPAAREREELEEELADARWRALENDRDKAEQAEQAQEGAEILRRLEAELGEAEPEAGG